MKGIELSKKYWLEVGRPAFERTCPELLNRAAVGLVGEGSECFGFDDEISRDHDWGPGFCLWLSHEDMERSGAEAGRIYASLPGEFLGYRRLRTDELSAGRVGVLGIWDFYSRFIGLRRLPESIMDWRIMPENGLATATNGEVFSDPVGEFSRIRNTLLGFYPQQLARKKLSARCAVAAQAGQYNHPRCLKRGDSAAAAMAAAEFMSKAQGAIFLLYGKYKPYYKWSTKALMGLGPMGEEAGELMQRAAGHMSSCVPEIEEISALIITELRKRGLSGSQSDFLLDHAREIQEGITDQMLKKVHLMSE